MTTEKYEKRILDSTNNQEKLMIIEKEVVADEDLNAKERRQLLKKIQSYTDTTPKPLVGDDIGGRKLLAERKTIDHVSIIGHLIGYTIGNCAIPNELVELYWEQFEIDALFMPNFCRQKDAFKNACASMERLESEELMLDHSDRTIRIEWVAEQLSQTEYMLTRQKVEVKGRIIGDKYAQKRTLKHENIVKFELIEREIETGKKGQKGGKKKETEIEFNTISQGKKFDQKACELDVELKEKIEWFMVHTTDKRLRDAIRETIRLCGGINFTMGQGGAWFIPITAENPISQYKEFFKFVDEHHRIGSHPVLMRTIPLIDDYDVRAQIEEDVVREVKHQMEKRLRKTLLKLTGVDSKAAEEILSKKLVEHGKSLELLGRYKELLARDIKIELEMPDVTAIKMKGHQELSGRSKALLRRLTNSRKEKD